MAGSEDVWLCKKGVGEGRGGSRALAPRPWGNPSPNNPAAIALPQRVRCRRLVNRSIALGFLCLGPLF
ncbi:MAG: hypothetical protein Fur0042_23860 [Cyanophyceae cyanobacterium]